jgi:hypothetical protein
VFFYEVVICRYLIYSVFKLSAKNADSFEMLYHSAINKELFIGRGGYMVYNESNHQITGIDDVERFCFYSINTNTSHWTLCNFGDKGQGPDDFFKPFSLQYIDEKTLGCFDVYLKNFSEFSIFSDCSQVKKSKRIPFISTFSVIKTGNNQYIGIGPYENEMFVLFDSIGNRVNSFYEYPYRDSEEKKISNRGRSMAYQGKMVSNLDQTKFVYATSFADIIHFYEIKKDVILPIKKIENRYPEYIIEEKDGGVGAAITSNSKHGYVCGYATNEYVYLLYSGRSFTEYKNNIDEAEFLMIYDWNGVLQKTVQLDIPCKYFCVDNENQKLWALSNSPDPVIVTFNIADIL